MNSFLPKVSSSSHYFSAKSRELYVWLCCGLTIHDEREILWKKYNLVSGQFRGFFVKQRGSIILKSLKCQNRYKYKEAYEVSDVASWSLILRDCLGLITENHEMVAIDIQST